MPQFSRLLFLKKALALRQVNALNFNDAVSFNSLQSYSKYTPRRSKLTLSHSFPMGKDITDVLWLRFLRRLGFKDFVNFCCRRFT